MKPPDIFEAKILDILLRELRRAMRMRAQLTIVVDPFVVGGGAHIGAYPNEFGNTYTIEKQRTKPTRGK